MPPDSAGDRPAAADETPSSHLSRSAESGDLGDLLGVIDGLLRDPSPEKRKAGAAFLAKFQLDVNIGGIEGWRDIVAREQQNQAERGRREDDRFDRGQWMAFGLIAAALVCGVVAVLAGALLAAAGRFEFAVAAFVIGGAVLFGATGARIGEFFAQARKMFSASRDSKGD